MDRLAEYITEEFGPRCDEFVSSCILCDVWMRYERLIAGRALTDEQISSAMHWLDRYAAGIDEYPQFDRVRGGN